MPFFEWVAIYEDGSLYPQYNADKSENPYLGIQRDRLSAFCILVDKQLAVKVHLDKDKILFCRRRPQFDQNVRTGEKVAERVFYIVGWRSKPSDLTLVCLIGMDGAVEVHYGFKPGILGQPIFMECEKI